MIEVTDPQKTQWVYNDIWRIATETSPGTPPPPTQLMIAGDYVVYKLSAPSLRLATYAQHGSAKPEDIFNVVSTQGDEHFNSYDKSVS